MSAATLENSASEEALRFSVHCISKHGFFETADTVKALTAVMYGRLFLLVNLFTSEILTNAGAKPRKSSMSYYPLLTWVKNLPSMYLLGLGI